MIPTRSRARGRSVLETTIVIIIFGIVLSLLLPALNDAVENARRATCQGNLLTIYNAMARYWIDYRGGKYMPASQPGGPFWFQKLERILTTEEGGSAYEKFICPSAPAPQRPAPGGLARDTVCYGWNEQDFPWRSVLKDTNPHEKLILGDSLESEPGEGENRYRADALVTADGVLRIDARHQGGANLLFLDPHVEWVTRGDAGARWPALTLAPPRAAEGPKGDPIAFLLSVRWWQWLLVVACVAAPYALVGGVLVPYVKGRGAALEEKARQQEEQEAREAKVKEQVEWEHARREYLKKVPAGPLEPTSLPRAAIHLERRSFQLQPDREVTLGRGETVTVRIRTNPAVSREHAKIRPEPRGYVLYDLYSRTGTFVNGKRVESQVLADGDRIRIGPNVELSVEIRAGG